MFDKIIGFGAKNKDRFQNYEDRAYSWLDKFELKSAILTFTGFQKMLWVAPVVIWFLHLFFMLVPILSTLDFMFFMLFLFLICILNLMGVMVVNRLLFYFTSDRTDLDSIERVKKMKQIHSTSNLQAAITNGAIVGLPFTFAIMPYLQFLRLHPSFAGWTVAMTDEMSGNPYILRIVLFTIPVIATVYFYQRMKRKEALHDRDINDWMENFHYRDPKLQHLLSGMNEEKNKLKKENIPQDKQGLVDPDPYIKLGTSIINQDDVIISPTARKQNSAYFGPIGAGKTSTLFIPQIRQDLQHYLRFIRDYEKISKMSGFMTEKRNIATHYLNGICVIETSDDLCASVYDLCMKLGIPKEKVIWLDPTNPETPALNLLRGPVQTVVETVTNIIAGVKAGNNDFFKESERNHLKNFIYLLKLTCVVTGQVADFSDLMMLYNDIYAVVDRRKILKEYVEALNIKLDDAEKARDEHRDSKDAKKYETAYAELKDKWSVAYSTLQWFNNHIKVATFGQGVLKQKSGPHEGEPMYIDDNEEFVRGLKNTLDDMSKNVNLRRVFFRDSGGFNLDDLLKNGGVLLCNTAKDQLQDALSSMVGQIYLMSFQAAAMRRKPDRTPLFPLYADEFPDFISEAFKSFVAQARKFQIGITIAAQSPAQLSYSFGQDFFNSLMDTMLTRGTFGDLGAPDAKLLEPFFGEHSEVQESINEQEIDLTADQDNNRRMVSARRQTVPNISASEIMSLPKFTIAVRHPGPHGSDMFDVIKTHYLTDEDILNDPNAFDPHDPRDSESYQYMISQQTHGNPDFDSIDQQIMADFKSGKMKSITKKYGKSKTPSGSDADDDLKNNPTGKKKADDLDLGSEVFPKSKDDSSEGDASEASTNEAAAIFSGFGEDDEGPAPSLTRQGKSTPEEIEARRKAAQKLASEAVHKATNHGGQGRLDNGTKEAETLPTPSKDVVSEKNYKDKESLLDRIDDVPEDNSSELNSSHAEDPNTLPKNVTEDKSMLHYSDGKILEDKKDRTQMRKENKAMTERQMKALRHQTLQDLKDKMNNILHDSMLDTYEKVKELKDLREKEATNIINIWPADSPKILKSIDKVIANQQHKAEIHQNEIKSDDKLDDIMRKSKETGSSTALASDLQSMMKQFSDRPISNNKVDQARMHQIAEEEDIDDAASMDGHDDPFFNQHGMDDNE